MAFSSDQPILTNQLPISIDFPRDQESLLTAITDTYKKTANVVNTKVGGNYGLTEVATFRLLYGNNLSSQFRNVYRKTFDLVQLNGANIGAGAAVNFPHNINGIANAFLIFASCTSSSGIFFTSVYPDVYLDATDVYFTNPLAVTLTQCIVIAEYTKVALP